MSIIENAMERLKQLAEEAPAARQAAADTIPATLPEATQQSHPLKLDFLRADKTPIGPTIDINFVGPMTDGNGALTKQFKEACATTVTAKLNGIRSRTLSDATSAHVFRPTHDGPLEQAEIGLDRLVGWMARYAPDTAKTALKLKFINVFGTTPPWDPAKTWDNALQNNPDQKKVPTPK